MHEGITTTPGGAERESTQHLPRSPRSVVRARVALREALAAWRVPPDPLATAELVLSELVTNAVRHAASWPERGIGIRLTLADGLLRLEVSDASAAAPQLRAVDPEAESGRGMHLVTALADNWGVTRLGCGPGKTVWAELKAPSDVG